MTVARALALLELPADVQEEKVATGELAPSVAYEVSRIRAVVAKVVSSGLSRSEAVERIRRATGSRKPTRGGKGRGPRPIKERTVRTATGRVDVTLRKAGDAAAIVATLREALAILEAEQRGASQEAA